MIMEDSESNASSSNDQTEAFEPPKNRFGIPYLLATDKEEKDPTSVEILGEFWRIFIPALIARISSQTEFINLIFVNCFFIYF